jgi:hypothetical protein
MRDIQLGIKITADGRVAAAEIDRTQKALGGIGDSARKAGDSLKYMIAPLTSMIGSGAVVASAISVQREFDKINTGLVTVTGTVGKAGQAFDMLAAFASRTPFSLQEVSNAFVKLRTLGLNPTEAALTSYGNTAAAMGKGLNQMIEAVADAATGEFERLKEFGIKARQNGDEVSLTFKGVTTTIGNNAAEIEAYLQRIGNVDFAGAMARQAATLDGAISNLGDSWSQLMLTISQSGPGDLLAESVRTASGALGDLSAIIKELRRDQDDAAKSAEGFASVQAGIRTVFEVVAVGAANASFMLNTLGMSIGAAAAKIEALSRLDFAGFMAIDKAQMADAQKAAAELEKTVNRILNPIKQLSGASILDARDLQLAQTGMAGVATATERAGKAAKEAGDDFAHMKRMMALLEADTKALEKAKNDLAESQKRENDAMQAAYAAGEDRLRTIEQQAQALERESEVYGLTRGEIERTIIARMEEARSIAEANGALPEHLDYLQREIDLRKRLAAAADSKEALDANDKATKQMQSDWEKMHDQLSQSLTDALMGGGMDAGEALQRYFKTLVLRPIIQGVVNTAMGAVGSALGISGPSGSSGGGLLNTVSGANTLWNMTQPGSMYYNFATGGIGQALGLGTGLAAATWNAGVAGAAATGLSTGTAVYGLGSTGTAIGGLSVNAAGGAATLGAGGGATSAGLSGFGAAVPWVLGGLALLSAFGVFDGGVEPGGGMWVGSNWKPGANLATARKLDPEGNPGRLVDSPWGIMGAIVGGTDNNDELELEFAQKLLTPAAARDYAISKLLTDAENAAIKKALEGFGKDDYENFGAGIEELLIGRLGIVTDAVGGWIDDIADTFTGSLDETYNVVGALINLRGNETAELLADELLSVLDVKTVTETITTGFGGIIGSLTDGAEGIEDASSLFGRFARGGKTSTTTTTEYTLSDEAAALLREGESIAEMFLRVTSSLVNVNPILQRINVGMFGITLAGGDMASSLVDALGGMEQFTAATSNYYGLFHTQGEQWADAMGALATAFDDFDVTLPSGTDAFRDLVESLDMTTDAGRETFASLMEVAPAFKQIVGALEDAMQATSTMFETSIRTINLDMLDTEGKYNFLDGEAARYRDVLSTLSDPTLIAEYAGRLNDSIMQAWGLLDEGQRQSTGDEYIALLEAADDLAMTRYEAARDAAIQTARDNADMMATAVRTAVTEAMSAVVGAAQAQTTSNGQLAGVIAQGIQAHVTVDVNVPQYESGMLR